METYGGIDLVLYRNGIRYLLPSPINSEYDDFGLTFDNNSDGYFTSNRSNQLFNDQVYKFTLNRSYDAILLAQETVVPVVVDTVAIVPVAVAPVMVDTVAVAPEVVIPVAVVTDTIIPVVQIGNLDPDSSAIVKIENNPKVIENQVDDIFETIVYFEFDKYESILDTNSVLRKIIKYMAAHPNKMVVLNGHTDKYGPYMYNIELSKKRAIILRRYLMAKGVDPIQIKYGIYGESKPLVKQHNRKASAINRRVEVFVLDKN